MTKILFTETNCSWNKGSAAQLISTCRTLRRFISDADFTLLTFFPELDSQRCGVYNMRVVGYSGIKGPYLLFRMLYRLFRCILWAILHKIGLNVNTLINERILQEYADADIIIDLSGDAFSDSKGGNAIIRDLNVLLCIILKKKRS